MKIFVFAERDWSFENIEQCLKGTDFYRCSQSEAMELSGFDLFITCEPGSQTWRLIYREVKGRKPVVCMQQGFYWSRKPKPPFTMPADIFLCWGEAMRDVCEKNGFPLERVAVTGCPRYDHYFEEDKKPENGIYVILGSGGEGPESYSDFTKTYFPNKKFHFFGHPNTQGYKDNLDRDEVVSGASGVVFRSTGAGIQAMLQGRACCILPDKRENYLKHPAYGKKKFSKDHDAFLKWAITGPGSTERAREAIQNFIGEEL